MTWFRGWGWRHWVVLAAVVVTFCVIAPASWLAYQMYRALVFILTFGRIR